MIGGPINGDGVGCLLIWGGGELGLCHTGPCGTLSIDFDRGIENAFPNLPLRAGKAGGYGDVADIPLGDQVAPQGNLAGVKRLVLVTQAQLRQGAVGVHVGHQAHHFRV